MSLIGLFVLATVCLGVCVQAAPAPDDGGITIGGEAAVDDDQATSDFYYIAYYESMQFNESSLLVIQDLMDQLSDGLNISTTADVQAELAEFGTLSPGCGASVVVRTCQPRTV